MTQDLGTVDPDSVECQVPILIWHYMLYSPLRTSSSGMVCKDAEKLYGEVRADAKVVVDNALCVCWTLSLSHALLLPPHPPRRVLDHYNSITSAGKPDHHTVPC